MATGSSPQGALPTAAIGIGFPFLPITRRFTENLGVTDQFSRSVVYKRLLSDNVGVGDLPITSDVRIWMRIFTENIGVNDKPNKLIRFGRNPIDSIGINDQTNYAPQTWLRLLKDNIGVTDAPTLPLPSSTYKRTVSDNLGVSDVPVHGGTYKRIFSENLGLTDNFVGINKGPTILVQDNIGVTDQQSRTVPASFRVVSENLGIGDLISRLANALRSFQESLGVTDSPVPAHVSARLIQDNIGITDLPTRVQPPIRAVQDNIGINDSLVRTTIYLRLITDNIGISDQFTRTDPTFRLISDSIGIGDQQSTSPAVTWRVVLRDNIGLTDLLTRLVLAHQRMLTDNIGIADFPGRGAPIQRMLSDNIGVQDLFQASGKPYGLPIPPPPLPPVLARWSTPVGAYGQEWYMVTGRDLTVLFIPFGQVNIIGWKIRWQLRYPDGSGTVALNKDTATGGLVVTDVMNGLIQLTLVRADTLALPVQGNPWFWELRRYDIGGSAALAKGTLYIDQDLAD